MEKRERNSPGIREIIKDFLNGKVELASTDEIYRHVAQRIDLKAKRPRASVFSVLTKMPEVVRTGRGQYILSEPQRTPNE